MLRIDVRYYDGHQMAALSKLQAWPQIQQLVAQGLSIPKEQFLVYSLFRNRDTQSLDELRELSASKERLLRASVRANEQSFSAHPNLEATEHRPEAQEIGEALGLCFMDSVFGTHEADWTRIHEGPTAKTLDYWASNGHGIIEVESKGSFVEDRAKKAPAISNHKKDIESKKATTSTIGTRIGTIAAIDRVQAGSPILWLVDPPPNDSERSPQQMQTLHRLQFLTWVVSLISPRSALAAALATRLADAESIEDVEQLSGVPLMAGSRTQLAFSKRFGAVHNSFFGAKSVVDDGPAGGAIVRSGERHLFFFGIQQEWVDIAVKQDFEHLRSYAAEAGTAVKRVTAVLPAGRFKKYGLNPEGASKSGGYYRFAVEGELHYTRGGTVFGWLPIPRWL